MSLYVEVGLPSESPVDSASRFPRITPAPAIPCTTRIEIGGARVPAS
jgi:hypothetical protein